ncbi:hypothetical protein [Methylotuvimicrobium sp. KM2]|jgi:hypothetical protein
MTESLGQADSVAKLTSAAAGQILTPAKSAFMPSLAISHSR